MGGSLPTIDEVAGCGVFNDVASGDQDFLPIPIQGRTMI
jgi:hypothetical protein